MSNQTRVSCRHEWVEDTIETNSGTVIESTICKKCRVDWYVAVVFK